METKEIMDKTAIKVSVGVMIALMVGGMALQVLVLSLPNFMKDLHISPLSAGALSTYTLIGMGVGGIGSGWLADRIGRVRVTVIGVVILSVFTTLIGFCQSYWQIAFIRFISGFGIGGVYAIGSVLAAEYVPTRIRNTVLGILQAGWSLGYVVAAIAASYLLPQWGWRPLFFISISGLLAIAFVWGSKNRQAGTRQDIRQLLKKRVC